MAVANDMYSLVALVIVIQNITYCLIFICCRLKCTFTVGDNLLHRRITTNYAYGQYSSEQGLLTKREFGIVLRKVFPTVKTEKGPTVNNKRVVVYTGLIIRDQENAHQAADHQYATEVWNAKEPLKDKLNTSFQQTASADHTYFKRSTNSQGKTSTDKLAKHASCTDIMTTCDLDDQECESSVSNDDSSDEEYCPFPSTPVPSSDKQTDISTIIGLLPEGVRANTNFTNLLEEQVKQASKPCKTSHRWSVR